MIPIGPNADGVMTFKMSGMFAEVFDNLQVKIFIPTLCLEHTYVFHNK